MLTPKGADPSQLNLGAVIMAGGTAGVAMWAIAIPPDVSLCGSMSDERASHKVTCNRS